jgi:nitrous oxidase accessory protein
MTKLVGRPKRTWIIPAIAAAALLMGAIAFPLWRLELVAPQYPAGLAMYAYGYKFASDPNTYYNDVHEINGLNHYIGMRPIETVTEMELFIPGIVALIAVTFIAGFVAWHGKLARGLVVAGYWFMPLFFVASLQFWLWRYGNTLDESAALSPGSFTPTVVGTTKVWNFHSETQFELGFYMMVAAALVMTFGPLVIERLPGWLRTIRDERSPRAATRKGAGVAVAIALGMTIVLHGGWSAGASAETQAPGLSLQERIDAAAPEEIVLVEGGIYEERIVIDKPISVIGRGWPVIDGGGEGDVVTITGADVYFSGFVVQNSGRAISEEPAAIKVDSAERAKVSSNRIREAHFGVHVTGSSQVQVSQNDIQAGAGVPQERRRHGVYLWNTADSTVQGNVIQYAADGIHLEFSDDNLIVENIVEESRYAIHLMYAHRNSIVRNTLEHNLSGAVLMFSHDLIVKDNELSSNRRGATGAGMLLKDTDNIFAEGNRIIRNKFGMTIEGAPQSVGATAIFRHNLVALNDVGVGLSSNSPITFVENSMIDNVVQVKALTGVQRSLAGHGGAIDPLATAGDERATLPRGAVWSSNGRGNYWSDYVGYDSSGDGVGDQPYRQRVPFAGRLAQNEQLQLFQYTPAQQAIDMAGDMFPVYRYEAVMEDPHPLLSPPEGVSLARSEGMNYQLLALSVLMLGVAGWSVAAVRGDMLRNIRQVAFAVVRPQSGEGVP